MWTELALNHAPNLRQVSLCPRASVSLAEKRGGEKAAPGVAAFRSVGPYGHVSGHSDRPAEAAVGWRPG